MHIGLIGAVLAMVATLHADAAEQQKVRTNERYCLVGYAGGMLECRYETMKQCVASNISAHSRCVLNPWLASRRAR